jgi:hypothetical protein
MMRLQVGVAALAVAMLAAGGAFAQAQGTFGSSHQPKGRWSIPDAPGAPSAPNAPKPKAYGAPDTPAPKTFEPYKPYTPAKPKSVYGPGGTTTHTPY